MIAFLVVKTIRKTIMSSLSQDEINKLTSTQSTRSSNEAVTTYKGNFIGDLTGIASYAKALLKSFRFSIIGDDASGYVDITGDAPANLVLVVSHAAKADSADYTAKAGVASLAFNADLANLATFALEAGCLRTFVIKFTEDSAIKGTMTWDGDTSTVTMKIDKVDLAKAGVTLVDNITSADTEKFDKTKLYFDVPNSALWFYDNQSNVWKNLLQYITDYLVTLTNKDTEQQAQIDKNTADIADLQPTKYTVTFNNKTYSMRNTLIDEVSNG